MTLKVGVILPELVIEVDPTFVIAAAIATRDFQDVHHDRDRAVQRGSKDIFINILTTTGLVQRYVTGWAGPQALVRQIAIRLGAPCYAGDTLTFSGQVVAGDDGEPARCRPSGAVDAANAAEAANAADAADAADPGQEYVVQVVGRCSLGDHVTGTVRLTAAGSAA
jgi:hypothetical protein